MYRRRRIAVGVLMALILIVLGGGVWAAVAAVSSSAGGPGPAQSSDAAAAPSASATDSAAASQPASSSAAPSASAAQSSAAPSPSPSATPACDPHLISVSAATDKASYAPADKPVFTLKVTNGNTVPCAVNVGTTQMEFLVVSGADRIFSSKDCQADAQDLIKTIPAGGSETANFPWQRVRSTEGCKAVTGEPKPGIYVLTASLGPVTSSKAVFELK
ncbi:hypothetical protein SAT01_06810 [Sinomonas atrocyanea]|nr:hypothetical protein SAT01_06810 [Sinomonas atrocyanea]